MHTLDALNDCDATAFAAALDGVFEHAPWVAATAASGRPFATVTALHEALMAVVRAAPEAQRLAFLRGHPELSAKALADAGLTAESRAEQTGFGLAALGADATTFEARAHAYRERFGIPFILCVTRHTARSALRVLNARLATDPATQQRLALDEIAHITRLRLVARVEGPGAPRVNGHLSTHVLDTARGRAASGIRVVLSREGAVLREAVTNHDGRVDGGLLSGAPLRIGAYELRFQVGGYFAGASPDVSDPPWYDEIPICFTVAEAEADYHVPLLLAPWSYATYRGS